MATADTALQRYLRGYKMQFAAFKAYAASFSEICSQIGACMCDLLTPQVEGVDLRWFRRSPHLNEIWALFSSTSTSDGLATLEEQRNFLRYLLAPGDVLQYFSRCLIAQLAVLHDTTPDGLFAMLIQSPKLRDFIYFELEADTAQFRKHFELSTQGFVAFCSAAQFLPPVRPLLVLYKLAAYVSANGPFPPRKTVRAKKNSRSGAHVADFARQRAEFELGVREKLRSALRLIDFEDVYQVVTDSQQVNGHLNVLAAHYDEEFFSCPPALDAAQSILDICQAKKPRILQDSRSHVYAVLADLNYRLGCINAEKSTAEWPICYYKDKAAHIDFLMQLAELRAKSSARESCKSQPAQTRWSSYADGSALQCVE